MTVCVLFANSKFIPFLIYLEMYSFWACYYQNIKPMLIHIKYIDTLILNNVLSNPSIPFF